MNDGIKIIECEEAIRQMLEYLDDELHKQDSDTVHHHLESCRECYSRMEFEKRLKNMVRDSKDEKAPASLNNRITNLLKKY